MTAKYKVELHDAKKKCVLRYRPDEMMHYVIEKEKLDYAMKHDDAPIPRGFPVPSARVKDWYKYVAQYDPFNWSGTVKPPSNYISLKEKRRRAKKQGA